MGRQARVTGSVGGRAFPLIRAGSGTEWDQFILGTEPIPKTYDVAIRPAIPVVRAGVPTFALHPLMTFCRKFSAEPADLVRTRRYSLNLVWL